MGCGMDEKILEQLLVIVQKEINKPQIIEGISIILSIIALVVSGISIFYQIKLNNTNLQSIYFEEIFGKYLKDKIPRVMERLDFNASGKLCVEYRQINKEFMAMIRDCGYFKYAKNDFYYELTEKTKDLEEHLVDVAGKIIENKEQQKKIKLSLHKEVQDIFALINKNYQRF